MKPITTKLLVLVMSLFLAACGDDGPDMKAGFAADVPKGWELESFKITASEEVGTKVSPVSQHRFVAEVAPSEDLFERVATLQGKDILKRVFEKGTDVEVHGVGVAVFTAGKWETHFQIEKAPFHEGGKSAKSFGANQVVVGSSEYRALTQAAKDDLQKLQEQSDKLAVEVQQKMAELQASSVEAQKKISQNSELVARVQQETRTKQQGEYQAYSQKVQEISNKYAGEFNTKRAESTASYNEKKKALDTQYSADIKQIRAERSEAGQWRQTERKRALAEYNAAITDARKKKLDAASLASVKSAADAKARAEYAAIDGQAKTRVDDTVARETKVSADYRAAVGTLQSETQAAMKTTGDEITGTRDAELAAEKKKYDDLVAASSAELTEAQNAHNALVKSANERNRQLSSEIAGMNNQLNSNGRNFQNVKEVLTFLESKSS
jgi:hypothetical protein